MKKLILAAAAVVGSVIATGALAQVDTYSVPASGALVGTTGKYNVTVWKLNGTSGNAATQFRIAFAKAAANPNNPNDPVTRIEAQFFSFLGTPGPGTIPLLNGAAGILGTSGLSTLISPVQPAGTTLWANTNVKYNGSSQLYNAAKFSALVPATKFLSKGGTNTFLQSSTTGSINLKYRAFSVKVSLFNNAGTRVWSGSTNVSGVNAPEGSSLALLAAGLLPLGLVARRRLRSRG